MKRRLMVVCPHPDDELASIGVMARQAAAGDPVTLVTCTLGERGEVVIPELEYLRDDRDDALGPRRLKELSAAMAAVGVTDHVRLGGDFRWHDSGMAYGPHGEVIPAPDAPEGCLSRGDLLAEAADLVPLIRDRRPTVLICDDERGSYGHPDHIQSHRVAMYGALLAAVPSFRHDLGEPWSVRRVLWTALPVTAMRAMADALSTAAETGSGRPAPDPAELDRMLALATPDSEIDVRVNGYAFAEQRFAATAAHATQIRPDDPWFALRGVPDGPLWDECFRLAAGVPFVRGATDVFATADDG